SHAGVDGAGNTVVARQHRVNAPGGRAQVHGACIPVVARGALHRRRHAASAHRVEQRSAIPAGDAVIVATVTLVVVIALVVVALIVAVTLIVRHAERDLPRADTTERVGCVEEDVIHAPVALAFALDQHGGLVRADAAGIGTAAAVDGLVLADRVDRDRDGIAVGIDYAIHRDRHRLVVRRAGRGRNAEPPVADRRPDGGGD